MSSGGLVLSVTIVATIAVVMFLLVAMGRHIRNERERHRSVWR